MLDEPLRPKVFEPGVKIQHKLSGVIAAVKNFDPISRTYLVEDGAGIGMWIEANVQLPEAV